MKLSILDDELALNVCLCETIFFNLTFLSKLKNYSVTFANQWTSFYMITASDERVRGSLLPTIILFTAVDF